MTDPSMLIFPTTCWFSPRGNLVKILNLVSPNLNSAAPLSPDIPMSFKSIFLELALETPSPETVLGKVIKAHLQGSQSFLLTATTLDLCYSKRFFPVTH